jgi:hypothetical protein
MKPIIILMLLALTCGIGRAQIDTPCSGKATATTQRKAMNACREESHETNFIHFLDFFDLPSTYWLFSS